MELSVLPAQGTYRFSLTDVSTLPLYSSWLSKLIQWATLEVRGTKTITLSGEKKKLAQPPLKYEVSVESFTDNMDCGKENTGTEEVDHPMKFNNYFWNCMNRAFRRFQTPRQN